MNWSITATEVDKPEKIKAAIDAQVEETWADYKVPLEVQGQLEAAIKAAKILAKCIGGKVGITLSGTATPGGEPTPQGWTDPQINITVYQRGQ